jgi:hypothetical protein
VDVPCVSDRPQPRRDVRVAMALAGRRTIGNRLAALDDFRNWLVREAA